jgi:uncharacterized damage-inducible protein DinB
MTGAAMITPAYARAMAAYNSEMNRRVYAAASRLPDDERRADSGAFWRSIHGTLNHMLWSDRMWLARFGRTAPITVPLVESDRVIADFGDLRREHQGFDAEIEAWAAALEPTALEGDLSWWSQAVGREMRKPRQLAVMQLFNHQTHHRGQVHALLTRAGEATGDTDLPFVLPEATFG